MRLRYNYRAHPDAPQRRALAKAFGCARVVWNDCLRDRKEAHAAGLPYVTSAELSRLRITQAKRTEERAWLADVSAVVLQQSLRDLDTAYKNFFDSLTGKRKGRKAGPPRFKSKKDTRQSVRLNTNAFCLQENGTVYVAKVGNLKVTWSRRLPAAPTSVTVTKDSCGRYFLSFVVDTEPDILPEAGIDTGIDLGLSAFAVLSDGTKIASPRFLRRAEKKLRRLQRELSRKVKGSKNVEDLAVSGLARTRLAKSVHDAGWSAFTGMLEYKAARHGRTFVKVGRAFPSSQICSACGFRDGPKPLHIREWTCSACGTAHDRDHNAGRNVLFEGRRIVAAGRAETRNACGASVRRAPVPAQRGEAGSSRKGRRTAQAGIPGL
ncbi:RNA-guided endonuclease InsQ/TnpB family protein [Streptomyces acidiscabies]|uniref:Transposase n=1 Tax=Streptomyces acidiscabies TaxID=42234 RepID=A0A0L0JZD5_9ACTN|nr:RNA-guided endonuclease TnpB family protein [Streptomyces acidiscabies]KND30869.1 transposase [Streptomyces acidiscabies]